MNPKTRFVWQNDKRFGNLLRFPTTKTAYVALVLALFCVPLARSANIMVSTNIPEVNADEKCSLAEAIINANADSAIQADCIAGSDADTIVLNHLTYTLTSTVDGVNSLPVITSVVIIEGNGATINSDRSASKFRIFEVDEAGDLTINNTILSTGTELSASLPSKAGGAILNNGLLKLNNVVINDNSAVFGNEVFNDNLAVLTMIDSVISDNNENVIDNEIGVIDTPDNRPIIGSLGGSDGADAFQDVISTVTQKTVGETVANVNSGSINKEVSFPEATDLERNLIVANNLAGGPECVSAGGSTAVTDSGGGFCLVSDLDTPITDSAHFSIANEIPVTGLQFLQATFADGSSLIGSRPIDGTSECLSAGGSTAATENAGGFCFVADLSTSITDVANFSIANDLPVAGLQFLQMTFSDSSAMSADAPMGAECVSAGGSIAASGNAGGFCLGADLTSTAGSASFSVVNELPVEGLQFLQVTFGENSSLSGSGPFEGAECVSVGGSTAASGNVDGSCLASDTGTSAIASANLSFANELLVTGLQFLQVTFGEGGSSDLPGDTVPTDAECLSDNGSSAVAGNTAGFCLVSDISMLTTGSANFSVANDLPIADLHFLQVPFEEDSLLGGPIPLLRTGTPEAVLISDSVSLPFRSRFRPVRGLGLRFLRRHLLFHRRHPRFLRRIRHVFRRFPPALDGIAGRRPRYFQISNQSIRN